MKTLLQAHKKRMAIRRKMIRATKTIALILILMVVYNLANVTWDKYGEQTKSFSKQVFFTQMLITDCNKFKKSEEHFSKDQVEMCELIGIAI